VEIFSISLCLANTHAFAVLPDVAFITRNAVSAVVNLSVGTADAIKYPIFFLGKLFQCLLLPLDLGLEMTLRQATLPCLELLTIL
jgi:hypothetical protein